jgi:cbb3-type cytochrome oxidase subunit 3
MSVDLSGEITAIATAALALFAIVTAAFAILAFRKQSQEVRDQAEMLMVQSAQLAEQQKLGQKQTEVLELQASDRRESLDERKRESEQRRSAQASRAYLALENFGATTGIRVVNTSDQPIYDAWVISESADGQHFMSKPVGTVMPGGDFRIDADKFFTGVDGFDPPGLALQFRDAAGIKWRRMGEDGTLTEESGSAPQ